MRCRTPAVFLVATLVAILAPAHPSRGAEARTPLVVWPGYTLELPAGYCADLSKGPDFDVLYVRQSGGATAEVLAGIYAGFAADFQPDCVRPSTRTSRSNGLRVRAVRGADSCAEFLIDDPTSTGRGLLHIWFGPAARDHDQLAENLVSSVRPAHLPVADATQPPACDPQPAASPP
jgi:hypothetical protein